MDKKIDTDKLLLELKSISDNIGIYPAAVESQDKEKSYKERDGFKNGWNACVDECIAKVDAAVENASTELSSAEKLFLADNEYTFWYSQESGWYVALNDTWYYACSDGEDIPKDKYNEVAKWYRKYGNAGALYWVYLQRGFLPTIPSSRREVEAIIEVEKEDLQAKKKRYRDYLTWEFNDIEDKKRDYCDIAHEVLDSCNKQYGPCPMSWDEVRYFIKDLMCPNVILRFFKRRIMDFSLNLYRYLRD
jgi:hypothetical protein